MHGRYVNGLAGASGRLDQRARHHAEIHRRRDGSFTITDLDSLNGVFVNSDQVKTAKLSEADLVELGDVGFRFTTSASEAVPGEETVMLKTAVPMARPSD